MKLLEAILRKRITVFRTEAQFAPLLNVQLDITDKPSVLATIEKIKSDVVVHCAAWTNVDAAEDETNKPLVHRINADGTRNMAEAAKAIDAKLVYVSTDYVFNGEGTRPWQPDDKDFKPLNYSRKSIFRIPKYV